MLSLPASQAENKYDKERDRLGPFPLHACLACLRDGLCEGALKYFIPRQQPDMVQPITELQH